MTSKSLYPNMYKQLSKVVLQCKHTILSQLSFILLEVKCHLIMSQFYYIKVTRIAILLIRQTDPLLFFEVPIICFNLRVTFLFQTNLPIFKLKESTVRRRYSDFEWLRSELERESKVRIFPNVTLKQNIPNFNI